MFLLIQNKNITYEGLESLRIIANSAGPVKEADAEKLLAKFPNKNLRFCQGNILIIDILF